MSCAIFFFQPAAPVCLQKETDRAVALVTIGRVSVLTPDLIPREPRFRCGFGGARCCARDIEDPCVCRFVGRFVGLGRGVRVTVIVGSFVLDEGGGGGWGRYRLNTLIQHCYGWRTTMVDAQQCCVRNEKDYFLALSMLWLVVEVGVKATACQRLRPARGRGRRRRGQQSTTTLFGTFTTTMVDARCCVRDDGTLGSVSQWLIGST